MSWLIGSPYRRALMLGKFTTSQLFLLSPTNIFQTLKSRNNTNSELKPPGILLVSWYFIINISKLQILRFWTHKRHQKELLLGTRNWNFPDTWPWRRQSFHSSGPRLLKYIFFHCSLLRWLGTPSDSLRSSFWAWQNWVDKLVYCMSNCGKMALLLTIPHFIKAHATKSLVNIKKILFLMKLWCHVDKDVKHENKY